MAFLLLAVVWPICAARAGVFIYELSFNTVQPSVNYSFLQGGYLVVDVTSQAVTSVVILTDPQTNLPYYSTGLLAGTYMELAAEGSDEEYNVIYSSSGSGGDADNVAFQIIGKTTDGINIGDGNSLSIAKKLNGYLLASAAETFTTPSNTTSDTSNNGPVSLVYGFAGTSKVTAKLQSALTQDVNSKRLDAAAALDALTAILENNGVSPGVTATTSTTTTTTTN